MSLLSAPHNFLPQGVSTHHHEPTPSVPTYPRDCFRASNGDKKLSGQDSSAPEHF